MMLIIHQNCSGVIKVIKYGGRWGGDHPPTGPLSPYSPPPQDSCPPVWGRHAKSREPGTLVPGHFGVKSGRFSEIKDLKK